MNVRLNLTMKGRIVSLLGKGTWIDSYEAVEHVRKGMDYPIPKFVIL